MVDDKYIKIGYVVDGDIEDRTLWSGTSHNLYKIISQKYNVELLNVDMKLVNMLYKVKRKTMKVLFKKNLNPMEISYSKLKSRRLDQILQYKKCDVIFAPANSNAIAFSKTNLPILYLSDATFHAMINYYFFGLDDVSIQNGNKIELNALLKANQIIYSSEWAKNDAISFYNINPDKINVLPFGSNLKDGLKEKKVVDNVISLLFVGVDWKRKGTDIALNCIEYLNQFSKRKYKLTIIGPKNPAEFNVKNVDFVGFLNKNITEDYEKLISYYRNSDVFILPTQAECAGIVFSEASMFGLPIVTYDTGGVQTYVKNEVNGYRLPVSATGKDFAIMIEKIFKDKETYTSLSENARKEYEKRLNWDYWLEAFSTIVDRAIATTNAYDNTIDISY